MFALASRVTGLRIEPEWFNGDFAVMPVTPVDDDPASMIYPPTEALTYDDGPLAWALLHAGDVPRRSVAGIAARYAADQAARHGARTARGRHGGAPEAAMPEDRVRAGRFWAKTAAREASGRIRWRRRSGPSPRHTVAFSRSARPRTGCAPN